MLHNVAHTWPKIPEIPECQLMVGRRQTKQHRRGSARAIKDKIASGLLHANDSDRANCSCSNDDCSLTLATRSRLWLSKATGL